VAFVSGCFSGVTVWRRAIFRRYIRLFTVIRLRQYFNGAEKHHGLIPA
jgi:hypothetical protein